MLRKLLIVLLPLTPCACATGYQSGGFTGGYYQTAAPGRLEKIVFSGNAYVDSHTVQRYALYRCAELAKEKKKPYFLIFQSLTHAALGRASDLPTIGSVGAKPTAFAFVMFLDAPSPNAIETEKTLTELDELIKKSNQRN